jgi:hypothetical protein
MKEEYVYPKYWGPHFWFMMRCIAYNYPDDPTLEEAEIARSFFNGFKNNLPCLKCQSAYRYHLKENPVEGALKNRDELMKWVECIYLETKKAIDQVKKEDLDKEFKKRFKNKAIDEKPKEPKDLVVYKDSNTQHIATKNITYKKFVDVKEKEKEIEKENEETKQTFNLIRSERKLAPNKKIITSAIPKIIKEKKKIDKQIDNTKEPLVINFSQKTNDKEIKQEEPIKEIKKEEPIKESIKEIKKEEPIKEHIKEIKKEEPIKEPIKEIKKEEPIKESIKEIKKEEPIKEIKKDDIIKKYVDKVVKNDKVTSKVDKNIFVKSDNISEINYFSEIEYDESSLLSTLTNHSIDDNSTFTTKSLRNIPNVQIPIMNNMKVDEKPKNTVIVNELLPSNAFNVNRSIQNEHIIDRVLRTKMDGPTYKAPIMNKVMNGPIINTLGVKPQDMKPSSFIYLPQEINKTNNIDINTDSMSDKQSRQAKKVPIGALKTTIKKEIVNNNTKVQTVPKPKSILKQVVLPPKHRAVVLSDHQTSKDKSQTKDKPISKNKSTKDNEKVIGTKRKVPIVQQTRADKLFGDMKFTRKVGNATVTKMCNCGS